MWSRAYLFKFTMMWSRAYLFKVTVHQILAEFFPFENFCKLFVSGELLLQLTFDQAKTWFIVRSWYGAVHIVSRLQSPNISRVMPLWKFLYFVSGFSYSLYLIKLKLDLKLDHDVEQCILFGVYSPPYISRAMPLWKFCKLFVSG